MKACSPIAECYAAQLLPDYAECPSTGSYVTCALLLNMGNISVIHDVLSAAREEVRKLAAGKMVARKAASLLLLVWLCVIGAVQGRIDLLNKGRSLAAADESTSANAADQRDPWLRNQGNGGNGGNGWGAGGGGGWGSLGGSSGPRNDNRGDSGPRNDNRGDNGGGLAGFGGGRNDRRNDRQQLAAAPAAAPLQQWFQQPQQPQQQGNPGISGLGGRAQGAQNLWTRGMGGLGGGNSNDNNNDNSDNSGQQQQGGNRGGRNNWLGGRQQQIAPVQTADPTPQPTIVIPDNNRNRNNNNNNDNVGGLAGRNQGWGNWGQQQGRGNQNRNDRNQEQQGATVTPAVVAPIGRGTGGLTGRPGGSDSWNGGRNRPSLSPLVSGTEQYGRINARPIQVDGEASALAQGLGRRGNARAAATALATAYNSGRGQAAAQAVASAAAGGGDAFAIGEAVAETTYRNPKAAPWLLRQSADVAVNTGNTRGFSRAMSSAFVTARRNRYMPQFTSAVADAIATGGAPTRYAYGQAIATAIADGGDGQAAVAEATATAFCSGGSTASAWAQAYAVALSQNSQGCLVLSQAKALAVAKCGNGVAETFSRAQATSTVLGFCGLFDLGLGAGWTGATTESSATGNGFSDANGWGNTDGGYGGWGKK